MTPAREPTEALRVGRRALEGVEGVTINDDLRWHEAAQSWTLLLRLSPGVGAAGAIPEETDWYILLDEEYPYGAIRFLPAKEGGITATFPHQRHNGPGDGASGWRRGEICLREPGASVWALAAEGEPAQSSARLAWHAERALEWLRRAYDGTLAQRGDPFELPDFPAAGGVRIGFSGSRDALTQWEPDAPQAGMAELVRAECNTSILAVREFRDVQGKWRQASTCGDALCGETMLAGWAVVAGTPVLRHWEAPSNWEGLLLACRQCGTDLLEAVDKIAPRLRDGQRHLLLLGFAIPETIGGAPVCMHWQGLWLPVLSRGQIRGFRSTEEGYRSRDRAVVLRGNVSVEWVASENWSEDHFSPRGLFPAAVRTSKVVLIGAGAMGAPLAELLVRGGLRNLLVMDDDTLAVPNLVRHTLSIDHVGESKAEALAKRLRSVAVWSAARAMGRRFPPQADADSADLRSHDVVVDCTGSDDALRALGDFDWGEPKLFLSYSLGYEGRRLYCFAATGTSFPYDAFEEQVRPWLADERAQHPPAAMPMEGPGCWHPAFPARVDSVWQMASIAAKHFSLAAEHGCSDAELTVYEERPSDGLLESISRASTPRSG